MPMYKPFESLNNMAEDKQRIIDQQRKSSGGLKDSSPEMPVENTKPYRGLSRDPGAAEPGNETRPFRNLTRT